MTGWRGTGFFVRVLATDTQLLQLLILRHRPQPEMASGSPGSQNFLPVLLQVEIDRAKIAFNKFDEDHSGSIDIVSWRVDLSVRAGPRLS